MWGEHVPRTLGLGDLYVWGNNTVTHLVLLERRGEAFSRSWTKPCAAIQAGVLPLPHDLEQLWDKWAQLWAVLPKTKCCLHTGYRCSTECAGPGCRVLQTSAVTPNLLMEDG